MEKKKLTDRWLKFLLLKDHISKILLLISVVGLVIFALGGFEALTLGMIFGGLLVASVIFSFCSYIFVGRYRESCVNKFYDAVRYSGDLPLEYKGRDLKRIKINWKGRQVKTLSFMVSTNSPAVQSTNEWRTVKRAAAENFKFENNNLLTFLEGHTTGVFSFTSASDSDVANNPEVALALEKEKVYAFAYEALSSHGYTLPMITRFDADTSTGRMRVKTVELRFEHHMTDYDMQRFESAFNRHYQGTGTQWIFEWSATTVLIKAVERGSDEERVVNATQSLERLIGAAVSSGFNIYENEEYIFHASDIKWSREPFRADNFSINFLRSDVSRPDMVEEFETLMAQGLMQLFPETYWVFSWDVDAFKKEVHIRRVNEDNYAARRIIPKNEEAFVAEEEYVFEESYEEPAEEPVHTPVPQKRALPARPTMKLPPRPPKLNL